MVSKTTGGYDLSSVTPIKSYLETWGVYRDRRPDQHGTITTLDGRVSLLPILSDYVIPKDYRIFMLQLKRQQSKGLGY